MKKLSSVLVLFSVLAVLIIPATGLAQIGAPNSCTINDTARLMSGTGLTCTSPCEYDTNPDCGMCCLLNALYTGTDWAFFFLIAIAIIFIIIGGFYYITSGGDPEKTKKGKEFLMYAAIGIAVGFLAKAVPAVVKWLVGA